MIKLYFSVILIGIISLSSPETTGLIQISDKYYVSETNATFLHAWVQCKTNGLQLAIINNDVENSNITKYLTTIGSNPSNCYWIGGVHLDNGAWMWISTGNILTYTNWATNEPDIVTKDDYCLQFGKDYGNLEASGWEAVICSTARYYICQV